MKFHPLRYLLAVVVILFLFALGNRVSAFAQGDELVYITSPTDGATVAGIITVTGAVDFPDFLKYELFLKTGDELIWGATVYAPVINGNLARLDTKTFADGVYQIIIRKVGRDSNYTEFLGPTLVIENNLGAPLPYPEVESSFLYSPAAGALARVRNCSGDNLEFDYTSPDGFCSADDLWIMFKAQDSPTCPFVDVLLIPCEYRGTAIGQGVDRGATYSFVAEAGKIYELTYPGGDRLFIGEVAGDERADTDTGGLDLDDPARPQPLEAVEAGSDTMAEAAASDTAAEADETPAASEEESAETSTMLPVSGQGTESKTPYAIVAGGLILFLIVGGIIAARKRGYTS